MHDAVNLVCFQKVMLAAAMVEVQAAIFIKCYKTPESHYIFMMQHFDRDSKDFVLISSSEIRDLGRIH